MYNFIDSWSVIFKNDGKPLVGKIEFCDPVTTELKTIYDVDGAELSNPIYCNGVPSNQVMLDNGDYTVRYYEYIGNGNMESDENEASWHLFKTELIKQNVIAAENDTTGVSATLTTIEQLKETEVPSDGTVVGVVGYYNAEDCPLRYYVWHETGNYTEDGGIVIRSNHTTTGAWIMKIPGTYIDVRWYGDIPSNQSSATSSSLGQRVKAANAANKYDKDLYFPSYNKGNSNGFYMFDGSNTVSVEKNIICDWSVRFVVKEGTNGTRITCKELDHSGNYLFIPEYGHAIGGYEIVADWVKTAWFHSDKYNATGARVGYIIDYMHSVLSFKDTKIKVENTVNSAVFDNCEFVECYKQLAGIVTLKNMEIKTEWFTDDYSWHDATFENCTILLRNCKDADEYISLKNKIGEYDYGDLGEQELHSATVKGGSILENCYGTIVVNGTGAVEIHNASVTVTGLTSVNSLNLVDTWLTLGENTVVSGISLRRGSINSDYYMQSIGPVMIEDADIYCALTTLGQTSLIKNCNIYKIITATDIVLVNNRIYSTIAQRDVNGVVTVDVEDNYFGVNGLHSIVPTTANSVVNGRWMNNKCGYDTAHWIRIDRTMVKENDCEHNYAYIGNEEPWIQKYCNSNCVWSMRKYRGNKDDGRGIFSTYATPFVFWNTNTNEITVVNRSFKWRMFTVGSKNTLRNGHVWFGAISEGPSEVADHPEVWSTIILTWSKRATNVGDETWMILPAVNVGGYDWSFEAPMTDHSTNVYSNGITLGYFADTPRSSFPQWTEYPNEHQFYTNMGVFIDKDFESRPPLTKQSV